MGVTVEELKLLITGDSTIAQGELEKLRTKFDKDLSAWGANARQAGYALSAAITAPIVGIGLAAANAGVEFEKTMNAITGVLAPTSREMEQVRATALKMGADTVFSAKDAADAMLELGKAGFSTKDALAAVSDVLQLAAASGLSMGAAAELSARTLSAFGLKTEDLAHVNDVLAKAVNSSTLEIGDLRVAFGYVGPIATSFGISIEQTAAAISTMRDAGIAAETTGRALREGLALIANPTKGVTDTMNELGIKTFEVNGKMMGLSEIVGILHDKHINAAQALNMFGVAAGPGMFALIQQGRPALDGLTAQLQESHGAAKAMADAMMTGLPGAFEQLRGSIDTALITISKALEPALLRVLNGLTAVTNFIVERVIPTFTSLPGWMQTTAIVLTAIAAAVGPVLVVLGALAASAVAVAAALGTTVPAAFGVLLPFLGPVGWIAAGIAAVTAIWLNWDRIVDLVEKVYVSVKTWLGDRLGPVLNPVIDLVKSVMAMFDAFGMLVFAVAEKTVGYVAGMVRDVTMWMVDKLKPIWQPIGAAITALVDVVMKVEQQVVGYAQKLYEGVKTWLLDKFVAVVNSIKEKVDAVTGFFKDMYDKVVGHSYVPDLIAAIGSEFGKLDTHMVAPAKSASVGVQGIFQDMAAKVHGIVDGWLNALTGKLGGWAQTAIPGLSGLLQKGMSALHGILGDGLSSLTSKLTSGLSGLLGSAGSLFTGGLSSIISSGIGMIGSAIGNAVFHTESKHTNDTRDSYLAQFGNSGTDTDSGFMRLAARLTEMGAGEGGGALFHQLVTTSNQKDFAYVADLVDTYLDKHGGFAEGTRGRFLDFGHGTVTTLHGKERIVTEAEAQREQAQIERVLAGLFDGSGQALGGGLTVNVNASGSIFKDRESMRELADTVTDVIAGRMRQLRPVRVS